MSNERPTLGFTPDVSHMIFETQYLTQFASIRNLKSAISDLPSVI